MSAALDQGSRPHSIDYTKVYLLPRVWHRLLSLTLHASRGYGKGGWPDRLREWHLTMSERDYSVTLRHTSDNPDRRLDDMTFIAHAIEQRHVGGWQKAAFDIFAGTHPRFTGLSIRPRR